jgi:hypothetical protein
MRLRRFVSLTGVMLMTGGSSACGLMFGGTHQPISVQSSPEAATVTTTPPTGEFTTPTTLLLERKNDYSLTFSKEGYSPAHFQITHHMRGGILALDILFTGLLGIIPDAATGAWNGLSPQSAVVTMTKVAMVDGPDVIRVGLQIGHSSRGPKAVVNSSAPGVTIRVEPVDKH